MNSAYENRAMHMCSISLSPTEQTGDNQRVSTYQHILEFISITKKQQTFGFTTYNNRRKDKE